MSVHRQGKSYRVKWRDHNGRPRSKTFDRRGDADLYDAEIKRAKQLGPHLMAELHRGTETLNDFIVGPWRAHAATLAPKTRQKYRWVFTNYLDGLRDEPLVTLDVGRLTEHQGRLLAAGVRPNTVRQIFAQIAGLLQIAVEHGRIPANPVRSMRKVKAEPRDPVVPLEPAELEALIAAATGRDRAMIVLGGYFGLRPIEIRRVPWTRLQGDRLTIAKIDTKPSATPRTITGPAAGITALKAWRLEAGRPADTTRIIGLTARNMNQWNVYLQRIARAAIGRDDLTAYTLRHTHASALHYAGYTVPRAAERMGHTTNVHLEHYAHVIDGLGDQRYPDIDALIAAARSPESSLRFPQSSLESR
jgi:integrase